MVIRLSQNNYPKGPYGCPAPSSPVIGSSRLLPSIQRHSPPESLDLPPIRNLSIIQPLPGAYFAKTHRDLDWSSNRPEHTPPPDAQYLGGPVESPLGSHCVNSGRSQHFQQYDTASNPCYHLSPTPPPPVASRDVNSRVRKPAPKSILKPTRRSTPPRAKQPPKQATAAAQMTKSQRQIIKNSNEQSRRSGHTGKIREMEDILKDKKSWEGSKPLSEENARSGLTFSKTEILCTFVGYAQDLQCRVSKLEEERPEMIQMLGRCKKHSEENEGAIETIVSLLRAFKECPQDVSPFIEALKECNSILARARAHQQELVLFSSKHLDSAKD